ncbi:MAG TPA: LuxR C-terminal-related transcriptional regulator, partial [Mycobacteriales bacterium]|nr:LuxR C-terminal-related transcriptional regulator [Mycobacteriales bacterium]
SANEAEITLLERGGEARLIYERAALEVPGRLTQVEREMAAGERARTLPELPTKLLLADDRLAVVPLQAAPSRIESGVIVHPSALFEALSGLFDALWTLSLPLDPVGGARADAEPSADDRRLLTLLTAGLADEAISRQLGISYRTLQRRIHGLMDRLHVQTRFQLGVQATRHSWIDTNPADRTARPTNHP